ncbi:unnamed protein product [Pleuronectes platessa]|uniref:Uncharacterized protein n=1 Tax=Pleuronectes platessa TaxID=8262 RepID=A0A9N7UDX6_PLEPL|nr:unnamed protein product [Pleuronectes platessa]
MFIFVVKPLGTCRGWGAVPPSPSSPRRRRLSVRHRRSSSGGTTRRHWCGGFLSLGPRGWPLEGTGYAVSEGHSGRVSGPSRGSPQLRRPLGEPSVRAGGGAPCGAPSS